MLEFLNISYLLEPSSLIFIFIIWYLFVTDRDITLAIAERLGRSVSYYSGKVIWITGASSGLGEAMAYELASVGAKLILTARSENLLYNVKETCLSKSKGKLIEKDILVLLFDICELESYQQFVNEALAHFKRIDIFINNVGKFQIGNVHSTSFSVIRNLFEVNFFGGIHLTQILLKHFTQEKGGQIITVSSILGKHGIPAVATYVATKHALQGFFDSVRMEYNHENIKVTIVNPGAFRSNFCKDVTGNNEEKVFHNIDSNITEMTSKRCAHLCLTAGANHLYEVWISYQPHLFFLWVSQYFPDVFKCVNNLIWTKSNLNNVINGEMLKSLGPWKPLFSKDD